MSNVTSYIDSKGMNLNFARWWFDFINNRPCSGSGWVRERGRRNNGNCLGYQPDLLIFYPFWSTIVFVLWSLRSWMKHKSMRMWRNLKLRNHSGHLIWLNECSRWYLAKMGLIYKWSLWRWMSMQIQYVSRWSKWTQCRDKT